MLRKNFRLIALSLSVVLTCLFFLAGCAVDEGEFTTNEGLYGSVSTNGSDSSDGTGSTEQPDIDETQGESEKDTDDTVLPDKEPVIPVTINVKHYGSIKLELYPNIAPITVENFVNLASSGFYDGLTFHRVISGFVIQGGDPKGDGTGGSDKNIKGEFAANGVQNSLSHTRGVISMARNGYDCDSASSQFFICHQDNPESLDGQYAAFGIVTEGMDVVDAIAMVPTDSNDKPTAEVIIESITVDS